MQSHTRFGDGVIDLVKRNYITAARLISFGAFLSCSSCEPYFYGDRIEVERDSEAGRAILEVEQARRDSGILHQRGEYEAFARSFVAAARSSDVQKMISMTSLLTLRNDGKAATEANYREGVIPFFSKGDVSWNAEPTLLTDDTGNRGFAIIGFGGGARKRPFKLVVMKERGRYVIIGVHDKH